MKQETERLSDGEINKELFEYEMTEVILQLKGEFAKLSGKDLHLEAEQFALKPLNLPAAMPEVTIDPVQIAVDSVPVFETLSAMPEIAMHDSKIDCPDVSALNPIVIQPIAMHLPELDYPSVPDISTCHPFEISMEMPEISYDTPQKMTMLKMTDVKIAPTAIPAVSYDLKNLSVKIPDITMQQVAIPFDFPSISISKEQPVVALEKPTLDNPTQEKPTLEKPTLENPTQLNKDIQRTDLPKKEKIITDEQSTHSIPILSPNPSPCREAATPPERKGTEATAQSAVDIYREIIKDNIDYDILKQDMKFDSDRLDEIVDLMLETVCTARKRVRIAGDDYPAELVKSKFMKLDGEHIRFVLDCMRENTTKIRNIKQYLKAALFNAPSTIGNYYTSLVAHDMASGALSPKKPQYGDPDYYSCNEGESL